MKVVIFGGRDFNDRKFAFKQFNRLKLKFKITGVIGGEADGADKLGKEWAKKNGLRYKGYPAAWDDLTVPGAIIRYTREGEPYNVLAGFDRNQAMADSRPGLGIMLPGGSGTADMRSRLKVMGIRVIDLSKHYKRGIKKHGNI